MKKVSIIIPVYNAAQTLDRCVESVLAQTFDDFDVFLVNDGSSDSSKEVCEKWAGKDPRIRVLDKENGGCGAARNHAFQYVESEWVMFVDADDTVSPDYISNLYHSIASDDSYVLAVGGLQVYRDGAVSRIQFEERTCSVEDSKTIWGDVRLQKYGFSVSKLYNFSIIRKEGLLFDENRTAVEDFIFLVDYLCSQKGSHARIKFIGACDYHYYMLPNSITNGHLPYQAALYTYTSFLGAIGKLKTCMGVDAQTFRFLHSPVSYHIDRLINSIYAQSGSKKERRARLRQIDVAEYGEFKKCNTPMEKILKFLLVHRWWTLYDLLRKNLNV